MRIHKKVHDDSCVEERLYRYINPKCDKENEDVWILIVRLLMSQS